MPGNASAPEMLAKLIDQGVFWRLTVEFQDGGDMFQVAVFHDRAMHVYEDRDWRRAVAKAYDAVRKG